MASPQDPTMPLPAVLGWSNGGPTSLQLYALDQPSKKGPRWTGNADGSTGRTVEHAIAERHPNHEGDRYLVIRVGDRHESAEVLPAGWMEDVARLWAEIGKPPELAPTAEQLAELIRRATPELAAAVVAHLQLQVDESQRCWVENHASEIAHLRGQRAASVQRVAAAIRTYAAADDDDEGSDGALLAEIDEHSDRLAHVLVERGLIRG